MAAVRGERKSIIFCNDGEKTTNTHTNTLLKTIIRVRDRESDRRESENARERARQFIRGGRPKNNGNGVLSRTRTETDNKKKKPSDRDSRRCIFWAYRRKSERSRRRTLGQTRSPTSKQSVNYILEESERERNKALEKPEEIIVKLNYKKWWLNH